MPCALNRQVNRTANRLCPDRGKRRPLLASIVPERRLGLWRRGGGVVPFPGDGPCLRRPDTRFDRQGIVAAVVVAGGALAAALSFVIVGVGRSGVEPTPSVGLVQFVVMASAMAFGLSSLRARGHGIVPADQARRFSGPEPESPE